MSTPHTAAAPSTGSAKAKGFSLAKVIESCLKAADYRNQDAKIDLLKRMDKSDVLYRMVMRGAEERVAQQLIDEAIHRHNASVRRSQILSVAPAPAQPVEAPRRSARDTVPARSIKAMKDKAEQIKSLSTMAVMGFGELGKMTFGQLDKAIDQLRKQNHTNSLTEKFLRSVRLRDAGETEIVGDRLSEDRLQFISRKTGYATLAQ